jgi:hypothetical protein
MKADTRSARIQKLPLGKLLISSAAVAGMVGPYIFDWNETHIFNATWPPHAKFHNAQTMSSGVALGLATLFHLWRPGSSRESLDSAAITASAYYVSQLTAGLYPGTATVDPPGEDNWPQLKYTLPILAAVGLGYAMERLKARG